jgi:hypothetical protein
LREALHLSDLAARSLFSKPGLANKGFLNFGVGSSFRLDAVTVSEKLARNLR